MSAIFREKSSGSWPDVLLEKSASRENAGAQEILEETIKAQKVFYEFDFRYNYRERARFILEKNSHKTFWIDCV